LGYLVPDIKFFRVMRQTETWKFITRMLYNLRTQTRRTIWGDRLFLKFQGPTTILMSSRASRISDVLTARDVNEIADSPAGAVQDAVTLVNTPKEDEGSRKQVSDLPTGFHVAEVNRDGSVVFEDAKDVKQFTR
jgi:hypothetical protein